MSRYAGFIALGALVAAALLNQQGFLPRNFDGARDITHHRDVRPTDRVLQRARAIDGDSFRAEGDEVRLMGIDAPELRQTCRDELRRSWPCGRKAREHLQSLLSPGTVECRTNLRDRYGRTLARCSSPGIADIGGEMVRAGYAVDFMNGGYRSAEAEARKAKHGIWSGEFEMPAEYRQLHPRTAQR
ncbi:MAG TPA: thermonuclease family protein [Xanthobacteraceae bacterium]